MPLDPVSLPKPAIKPEVQMDIIRENASASFRRLSEMSWFHNALPCVNGPLCCQGIPLLGLPPTV